MFKWSLKDIILLAFIAFLFGGVFMGAGFLYAGLQALLSPLGYAPFANEMLFGMWVMAAPVSALLIPKAGSATLGELLAALAEMLYGSFFGPGVLISGLVQGFGVELGFIATKYRRYDSFPLLYGAVASTVLSFLYEYFKLGYQAYGMGYILALFLVRLLSVLFFCVLVSKQIVSLYEKMLVQKVGK